MIRRIARAQATSGVRPLPGPRKAAASPGMRLRTEAPTDDIRRQMPEPPMHKKVVRNDLGGRDRGKSRFRCGIRRGHRKASPCSILSLDETSLPSTSRLRVKLAKRLQPRDVDVIFLYRTWDSLVLLIGIRLNQRVSLAIDIWQEIQRIAGVEIEPVDEYLAWQREERHPHHGSKEATMS
jgi:hypothetical protein